MIATFDDVPKNLPPNIVDPRCSSPSSHFDGSVCVPNSTAIPSVVTRPNPEASEITTRILWGRYLEFPHHIPTSSLRSVHCPYPYSVGRPVYYDPLLLWPHRHNSPHPPPEFHLQSVYSGTNYWIVIFPWECSTAHRHIHYNEQTHFDWNHFEVVICETT